MNWTQRLMYVLFARELDAIVQEAYSRGATAVWEHVGCQPGGPNEAVWDRRAGHYRIVAKEDRRPVLVIDQAQGGVLKFRVGE
jgi:hypothetical protein